MSALALLEQAQHQGIMLALTNGRLTWSANHEPPVSLLNHIKSHRLEIIQALSAVNHAAVRECSQQWLIQLAKLLACSPDYPLNHGFVDEHDLAEQVNADPRLAADLIRSHPAWQNQSKHNAAYCDQYAQAREEDDLFSQPSAIWRIARDSFYNHALSNCPDCYPPLARYCSQGQALRSDYMEAIS